MKLVGIAVLFALTGTGAANVSVDEPTPLPDTGLIDERLLVLEPGFVHEAALAGGPITLPSLHGPVVFDVVEREASTAEIYHMDENGDLVFQRVHQPHVWFLSQSDGFAEGILLALPHKVSATITTPLGRSNVEPVAEGPDVPHPIRAYRLYGGVDARPFPGAPMTFDEIEGGSGDDDAASGASAGAGTDAIVTKTMVAYADWEFTQQYGGMSWPDQIDYIIARLNPYFDDVELKWDVPVMAYADPGTSDNDPFDDAFNWLKQQSMQGQYRRTLWSYVDYDGCTIGKATRPGTSAMLQHEPDACHGNSRPDTDFERAYLMAHELGHTIDGRHEGCSSCYWSDTKWYGHTHRSILHPSAWYHYHECWDQTNMDRMSSYLGKSSVGNAC